MAFSSGPLVTHFCKDPIYGGVYKMLFNGGSWFEGDQMFWRIDIEQITPELRSILAGKPTKSAIHRASALLEKLDVCAKQLVLPCPEIAEMHQAVKAWTPKPAAPRIGSNVFAALDTSDEE